MRKSNSENIPKGISNVFQPTISLLHQEPILAVSTLYFYNVIYWLSGNSPDTLYKIYKADLNERTADTAKL